MFNSPFEILCSPILIPQGLYTKYKTPRLNEADGARQGQLGTGTPLRLLLCGDSAAAGVGAELQSQALSGQLIHLLQTQYQCTWALEAKSGYTSTQLIQHLQQLAPQSFDIAVVSIGVNDVTKPISVARWINNIAKIHALFIEKFSVKYVIYTAVPPMQHFPALPFPLRYFLGKTAQHMNQQLQKIYADQKQSTVLSMQLPVKRQYMAMDGFHPSPIAYTLWAEHVAALIQAWPHSKAMPAEHV